MHAAEVHMQRNSELLMSGVRDSHITNKHLKAVSSVGEHGAKDIGRAAFVLTAPNKVEDFRCACTFSRLFHFSSVHYCDTTRRGKYNKN